jgi:Tn3 transposase DDE domain
VNAAAFAATFVALHVGHTVADFWTQGHRQALTKSARDGTGVWHVQRMSLQREINAGLNVVENYNGVNDYIFFGKSGELSTSRCEEQEISMICLQILQSCLGNG